MSEQDEMTCAELADVAAELALGVLTGRERARAIAHLEWCDACREHVRQLTATGEQLIELLPPAEPPAGFETQVLDRIGLPVRPAERSAAAKPPVFATGAGTRPRSGRPPAGPTGPTRPAGPTGPTGPSGRGLRTRPGRTRRLLAAVGVVLAVIVAGIGGWRIGAGPSPAHQAALAPTSTVLLSADKQNVGSVLLYSGTTPWLYMSVDLGSGDQQVTCQVVSADGRVSTIGSFWLSGGHGTWVSTSPGDTAALRGARLVSANGTVLATASFSHW
jgi:hypothetical protein